MPDELQTSPLPGACLSISLCGEEGLKFRDRSYVPDATKAFFSFAFSHAFPVRTAYETALHPAVIAKSFNSLRLQGVNREHMVAAYHTDQEVNDKYCGAIVDVEFPSQPSGGWKVQSDLSKSPGISGVAVVWKQAQGMAHVLGQHLSSRRQYTVSMEVLYPLEQAGFAVALNGKDPKFDFSPPDMLSAGWEFVPFEQAPEDLIATFSRKKNRVVARYKGRSVCVLMGGLNNAVHYAGAGVVQYGAEPPAKITRLAASAGPGEILDALAQSLISTLNPHCKK